VLFRFTKFKKQINLLFCLIAIHLLSCEEKQKNANSLPNRAYYADTVWEVSVNNCVSDSPQCNYVRYEWIQFRGNQPLDDTLNAAVLSLFAAWDNDENSTTTHPETEGNRFIKEYASMQKEMGQDWSEYWYYRQSIGLSAEFNKLIGLFTEKQRYLGGAHPSYYRAYLIINKETGARLNRYAILDSNKIELICELATKLFRQQKQLPLDQPLSDLGYTLPNLYLPLPDAIGLDPEGLVFYYPVYSIGPNALGDLELLLPFEQVSHLLRKDFKKMIKDGPLAVSS
jgi:hypothetical protein